MNTILHFKICENRSYAHSLYICIPLLIFCLSAKILISSWLLPYSKDFVLKFPSDFSQNSTGFWSWKFSWDSFHIFSGARLRCSKHIYLKHFTDYNRFLFYKKLSWKFDTAFRSTPKNSTHQFYWFFLECPQELR